MAHNGPVFGGGQPRSGGWGRAVGADDVVRHTCVGGRACGRACRRPLGPGAAEDPTLTAWLVGAGRSPKQLSNALAPC
jgi:hypothetical protein